MPRHRALAWRMALLLLLAASGAAADGSRVLQLHAGDEDPYDNGWEYGNLVGPYSVQVRGIADDQGFAVWEIDDPEPGEALFYWIELAPHHMEDAAAAGFTLRIRLRLPPQADPVHPTEGMAAIGLKYGPTLLFGTNAAPPAGDGNLRMLAVGGPSEVVIPGGSVHHLVEVVYDPAAGDFDILVDSVEVVSDWAAPLPSTPEVRFGSILGGFGVGSMRTNLIELEIIEPDCEDGLDNDGDGLVDALDPGCTTGSDDSEVDAFACNDASDDDGDGLVDLADPGCVSSGDGTEFDVGPDATEWVAETRLRVEHQLVRASPFSLDLTTVGVARLEASAGGVPFLQFPAVSGTAIGSHGSIPVLGMAALPSGTLALSTAVPANTHPLYGLIRYCIVNPGCHETFPFADGPLEGAGMGGQLTQRTYTYGGQTINIDYAPWTLGTATARIGAEGAQPLPETTRRGFAHGPLSATSTLSQTSGVLQLVTPMQIHLSWGPDGRYAFTFASLRVRFVPEPRPALLIGSGALLVGALGWRRARHRVPGTKGHA